MVIFFSYTQVFTSLLKEKVLSLYYPLTLGKLTLFVVIFSDVLEKLSAYSDQLTIFILFSKFLLHSSINKSLRLSWTFGSIDSPEEVPRRQVVWMIIWKVVFKKRFFLQHLSVYILHEQGLMIRNWHGIGTTILYVLSKMNLLSFHNSESLS